MRAHGTTGFVSTFFCYLPPWNIDHFYQLEIRTFFLKKHFRAAGSYLILLTDLFGDLVTRATSQLKPFPKFAIPSFSKSFLSVIGTDFLLSARCTSSSRFSSYFAHKKVRRLNCCPLTIYYLPSLLILFYFPVLECDSIRLMLLPLLLFLPSFPAQTTHPPQNYRGKLYE